MVAVGKKVLVGTGVGVSGIKPVSGVLVAKGVSIAGKVGGVTSWFPRGADDRRKMPPQ